MPYLSSMKPQPRSARRPPQSRRNWERAYDEIKELILVMGIRPGEVLSENALARRLSVSRTPVREALKALEREGLVVADGSRKRSFVLTIRDIEEIFDLKIALEGKLAGWAAERATPAQRTSLERVARKMESLAVHAPPAAPGRDEWHGKWLELDEEFHDLLFRMAGNARAEQVIRMQNSLWHRLRLGMIAIEGRIGRATGEHQRIAAAIVSGRAAEAVRLMEEHLRQLKSMLTAIMAAFHYPATEVDAHRP
jgi:DNA-binding GntR family transcriptional regulator